MRFCCLFLGILAFGGCRIPTTGSTPFAVDQGPADVAGLAWTTADLPKCIAERAAKIVFVVDLQTSVLCDPLSSSWVSTVAPAGTWRGGRAYVAPTTVPAGSPLCANGGIHTDSFVDANGNGRYDPPGDDPHAADDTCNGADGSPANYSLSNLPRGNADCPLGGLHILTWIEKDGSPGFGAGDQKVVDRNVCNQAVDGSGQAVTVNGHGALTAKVAYHPLKADKDKALCPNGGFLYEGWLSFDASRSYYNSEVDTGYVSVAVCTTGRVSVGSAPILAGDHCGKTGGREVTFLDTETAKPLDAKLHLCEFDPSTGRGELARLSTKPFTTPPAGSPCTGAGQRVTACAAPDPAAACALSQPVDLCPQTVGGVATQACTVVPLLGATYTLQCGAAGNVLIDAAHGFAGSFCELHTLAPGSVPGPPFAFSCDDGATYDYDTRLIPPVLKSTHPVSATVPPAATTPDQVNTFLSALTQDQMANLSDTSDQVILDVPFALSDTDLAAVISWIRTKTSEARLDFCWRQTYGRGVGTVPGRAADCPAGYTNNGLTCGRGADTISAPSKLGSCPAGYTNTGLTCFRPADTYSKACDLIGDVTPCRAGYTDFGCTCTSSPDTLSGSSMTCPTGYSLSSIDFRCIASCPSGYTNTGETCFLGASTLGLDSMTCHSDEHLGSPNVGRCYPNASLCGTGHDDDAGLCYPSCNDGYHGVGPVCWQNCDTSFVDCGAGCGKTQADCGLVIADQVLAPLIIVANLASMGLATPETDAVGATLRESLTVGSKVFSSSTKTGKALITVVKYLQTVKPAGLAKDANILKRIWASDTGAAGANGFVRAYKSVKFAGKTSLDLWRVTKQFRQAYSSDFVAQTSQEISDAIDAHFSPDIALYVKQQWGMVSLSEMTTADAWQISQEVLSAVAIVDITGVTGLVAAYAQPLCQDLTPFPTIAGAVNGVLQ